VAESGARTAGALLREARERQGLHIAVLAAAIKVSPRKLDALEGDRYQELPDATFTRALTQTVCRVLKIDPQPVLALLPPAPANALDSAYDGLNTPFRGRDSRKSGDRLPGWVPRAPLLWAAVGLLLLAALVMYWPAGEPPAPVSATTSTPLPPILPGSADAPRLAGADAAAVPGAASAPASGPAAAVAAVATAVPPLASLAASAAAALPGIGTAVTPDAAARPPALPPTVMPSSQGATISVTEPVWVEVTDARGEVVFQRTIQPGEVVNFEQRPPLKLRIGNAAGARLTFKGEPVDLTPVTRSNVARVELK
jgi:cytoskeleton protein RodZ